MMCGQLSKFKIFMLLYARPLADLAKIAEISVTIVLFVEQNQWMIAPISAFNGQLSYRLKAICVDFSVLNLGYIML